MLRRKIALIGSLALAATLTTGIAPASSAPDTASSPDVAAQTPNQVYGGGTQAELLNVSAANLAGAVTVADLVLGQSITQVDSRGGIAGQADTVRSSSEAHNLAPLELLDALDLSDLLVSASQVAPPQEAEAATDTLLDVPVSPIIDLAVSNAASRSLWAGDAQCVEAGTPISSARIDTAQASIVELDPLGLGDVLGAVAGLIGADFIEELVEAQTRSAVSLGDGVSYTQGTVGLVDAGLGNDRYAVQSEAVTQIDNLRLLGGLIEIGVVSQPKLTVTATGTPGGASVEYEQPVLNVRLGNPDGGAGQTITLGAGGQTVIETPDFLADILNLRIGLGEFTEEVAADGTTAGGAAALLRVDVELLAGGVDVVDLDLAPMSAVAFAPQGGVVCPGDFENPLRELNKHASALEVSPGGEFDYNISVPNRGPCAVTDVVVVDQIIGPAGFEVVGTEPEATVDGGTVTWELGTLQPNETRNLTIRVRVPEGAQDGDTFDDVVGVRGQCDGEEVEATDELEDIPTVRDNFEGPCNVGFSNKDASHLEVTPGQTFSYYVHAFNSGAEDCTGVSVVDTLDDRVSFVSCNRNCTSSGQTVTWNIDQLAGGSSMVLGVVVQVDENATGTLGNTAVIDPDNGDPKTVTTTGPAITDRSVVKEIQSPTRGDLPRTGSMIPLGAVAALSLGAVALLAIRRRAAVI